MDRIQKALDLLTQRRVSHAVYAVTSTLIALLGFVYSIRTLTPIPGTPVLNETELVTVNADVVVADTVRVCNPIGPSLRVGYEESTISKIVREPFFRIHEIRLREGKREGDRREPSA